MHNYVLKFISISNVRNGNYQFIIAKEGGAYGTLFT